MDKSPVRTRRVLNCMMNLGGSLFKKDKGSKVERLIFLIYD